MAAQVAARDPRGASSAFGVPEKPEMVPPTVEPPTLAAWRRRRRHVHVGLGSTARALPWTFGGGGAAAAAAVYPTEHAQWVDGSLEQM